MIEISQQLKDLIESRASYIVPCIEIYPRNTVDISSVSAPANAIARFSNTCFTWETSAGNHLYEAKLLSIPSVKTYLDDRQNEMEVTISNTERGDKSGARFILDNKIKGMWMVLRLIFPDLQDENWLLAWGKALRPGSIDNTSIVLSATQEIGNYKVKIPFRTYSAKCPLTPGKGDCIGNEPLSAKSVIFQQAYADFGTMLCPDRLFETCTKLGNTKFFEGQRSVAVAGQFSYVAEDATTNNSQKKKKKKNLPALKTESWSSLNQSDSNETIPIGFGRFQLAGHPFTWADTGTEVKSLQGFCEGKISEFDFIRCRNPELTLSTVYKHYGDWGGSGSQTPDILFSGFSGMNSRLAYLEVVTTGSKPENVDNAPLITAVIRGMQVPVPDVNGDYTGSASSDNPVHILRFLLTDEKFGRVPTYRMADDKNLLTSDICEELIEDRTQGETIVLPTNEFSSYGIGYRRYRSTGVYTAYTDMYNNGTATGVHPDFEEPWIRWYTPFTQQPLLPKQTVLRKKYTINGAIQESTSLLDIIQKRIMPCFRGWLNYNRQGKIEIRTRTAADVANLRADIPAGETLLSITNVANWRGNLDGYLVIGTGGDNAEVRKVTGINYSPGCNNLPMSVIVNGGLTAVVTPITGGSLNSPGIGSFEIGGSVTGNDSVILTFNSGVDEFFISYTTDGIEDLNTVARLVTAHLNANRRFAEYLTAYLIPSNKNKIYIRCEAGFVNLDNPLEYDHFLGEEVMRVQAVFENCNDLFSDNSASFDNILIDSFSWNNSQQDDSTNAYSSLYTSAVDDFHVAKIIPRTSWDTIDLEAELNEEELDLKLIDNYWQAAYITKSYAIENIDGNLPFTWRTGLSGFMLEMGDVVAVRHDSGDGVLKYTPVWIKSISYDLETMSTSIEAMLYLNASFDLRVQQIEPILTNSLNPSYALITPPSLGSSGGIGGGSIEVGRNYPTYPYLPQSRYSPSGEDII